MVYLGNDAYSSRTKWTGVLKSAVSIVHVKIYYPLRRNYGVRVWSAWDCINVRTYTSVFTAREVKTAPVTIAVTS